MAIGCDDSLEVWDLTNETRVCSLKNTGSINSVTFSPDSQVIAFGGKEGKLILWDTKKERNIFDFEQGSEIRAVVFNFKHKILASCNQDRTINIWQY